MEKTTLAAKNQERSLSLSRQSRLFKKIVEGIFEKKGEKVVSIDLRKIPESVADFFVICEASTPTQVKAIADNVEFRVQVDTNERPYRTEGFRHANWILLDYINVVVHIMLPTSRAFYQLEETWSDAPQMEHEDN